MAEVLTVESAEDKVNLLLLVGNVAEGRKIATEMLDWDNTTSWEHAMWFVMWSNHDERSIWFGGQRIKYLSVSEEHHDTRFHDILENEVLIIIANLNHIRQDQIVQNELPPLIILRERTEIIHFLLRNISIQNFPVDSGS